MPYFVGRLQFWAARTVRVQEQRVVTVVTDEPVLSMLGGSAGISSGAFDWLERGIQTDAFQKPPREKSVGIQTDACLRTPTENSVGIQTDGFQKPSYEVVQTELEMPIWEYLKRAPDEWSPCSTAFLPMVEAAHRAGQAACMVVDARYTYDIDLHSLTQTNRETGRQRSIRRRMVVNGDAALEQLSQQNTAYEIDVCAFQQQRAAYLDLVKQLCLVKQYEHELNEKQAAYEDLQEKYGQQRTAYLDLAKQCDRLVQEHQAKYQDLEERYSAEVRSTNKMLLSVLPDVDTLSTATSGRPIPYVEQPVPDCSSKFRALRDMFLQSMAQHRESYGSSNWCEAPRVEITAIWEITNPTTRAKFENARREVLARNWNGCAPIPGMSAEKCNVDNGHVDLNEYLLFHGCSWKAADSIKKQGLDAQRGGEAIGTMFGFGAYFAQNASKSDFYTTCSSCSTCQRCKHPTAERRVLVARVLLGESKVVTMEDYSKQKKEPQSVRTATPLIPSLPRIRQTREKWTTWSLSFSRIRWLWCSM